MIICFCAKVNQVLAVEKSLRIRPFKKILTIAWKKIYPNSQITSIPALDILKLRRKSQKWKKLRNWIEFAVWGGERYDGLKGITDSLSKSKVRQTDRQTYRQTERCRQTDGWTDTQTL